MRDTSINLNNSENFIGLAAEIVTAYVSNNMVSTSDLPELIKSIHSTLHHLGNDSLFSETKPKPAVPVKKSIFDDHIVCLEDGKKLKMLKRYLRTQYNMSPDEYRAKWGLPADYPMVAPNYAATRSEFAKKIGLGKRKK